MKCALLAGLEQPRQATPSDGTQPLTPGLCLKGRGAIREIPGRLQSGHRGCEAVGGRLLAVGNAVGGGVGVWECLWGRVRAGVLGGGGGTPPPSSDSLLNPPPPPRQTAISVSGPAGWPAPRPPSPSGALSFLPGSHRRVGQSVVAVGHRSVTGRLPATGSPRDALEEGGGG